MASSLSFSSSLSSLLPSFLTQPTPKIKPSHITLAHKTRYPFLSHSSSSPKTERTMLGYDPQDPPLQFDCNYNVKVAVENDEPEEKLLGRFRGLVFKFGIIQECKRRRSFENKHEKKKRKNREAAKKNRKWRPRPKTVKPNTETVSKKQEYDLDTDNWDLPEGL